jgi:hypothetical protein
MARPREIGLKYFTLDVDIFDDEKIIPVSSEFGAKGESIIIRVLCAIYRNGYFAECSDAFKFKIAKQANVQVSLVSEVITGLVKWGFFDKSVFDSFGVLTSTGIQKRWKEATRKRVINYDDLQFWLLEENDKKEFLAEETGVSGGRNCTKTTFKAAETTENDTETQQIKRNNNNINNPPNPPKGDSVQVKARKLFEDHFIQTFGTAYYWTAKDAGNMKQLLNKLKFAREQKKLDCSDENVLSALKFFLNSINDGWIFENYSVSNLNSKYNEIVSNLKTKNHGKQKDARTNVVEI